MSAISGTVKLVDASDAQTGIATNPLDVNVQTNTAALAAGTNKIGTVANDMSFDTGTHGSYKVLAANTANQRIGSGTSGAIYTITLANASAAGAETATLELATGPTTLLTFQVPAESTVNIEFGVGGFEWSDGSGIQVDTDTNVSGLVVYTE